MPAKEVDPCPATATENAAASPELGTAEPTKKSLLNCAKAVVPMGFGRLKTVPALSNLKQNSIKKNGKKFCIIRIINKYPL